ncbi:dnaJ domain containing protein, putative [Babesia bigemina]|uniref:DnaJ domain containing protein, putative n=1 Tax=Babesia bigemina TaxID=5866 RepID=A0A061DDA5_BABBI|nr:dnaJ domain containing protein, putative [Babesia bigemina]CDR97229.1 dnaJ domain containing protein, putative [Babesia bigemina]|eukprot:XP_012769415.1 dnaJ domain containing protein, putative [Babesia bigemina]
MDRDTFGDAKPRASTDFAHPLIDLGFDSPRFEPLPVQSESQVARPKAVTRSRFAPAGDAGDVAAFSNHGRHYEYADREASMRGTTQTRPAMRGPDIYECHSDSDGSVEERVMRDLTCIMGNSYYSSVPFSASGAKPSDPFATNYATVKAPSEAPAGPFQAAAMSEGAPVFFSDGEPCGATMQEAIFHLEKAEGNHNIRDTAKRTEDRGQQLRAPLIMNTRRPEDNTISKDPIISGLFSLRKPRDAGAGIVSGLKSVTKGVALGAASLVVCPVVGGHSSGFGGFVKGIGAGMLGAVALPVTGVGIAGYQIGRGIYNTPNAICQRVNGKKWNKQHCEWRDNWYSLEEEVKEVMNAIERQREAVQQQQADVDVSQRYNKRNVAVAETDFYDVLGVPPTATQAEIKRQYYKLAKQMHPDKTRDAESTEQFKKLGEAYQVLGDEQRRALYDQHGKLACHDMPILDSALFFMMLFGSESFEPYVGKMRMALFMELELGNRGCTPTANDFEVAQWDREVRLALNLRDNVRSYVCGNLETWYGEVLEKARSLCTNSFSVELVHTIGWTYNNVAKRYIGKWDTFMGIGGKVAKVQEQSKALGKTIKALTSMVKTAVAERSVSRSARNGEDENLLNEDYMKEVFENALPNILDTMLNICLMDVQSTVKKACKRILRDMVVDKQWRRKRAEGLGLMGRAFMLAAQDARQRLAAERKPLSMYEMFAQAAAKMQQNREKSPNSAMYRTDDGFF